MILQTLFREGSMAAPICDTSYLHINIASLNNDLVPAVVSLMRGMSNLNTLYIKSDPSLFVLEPKVSQKYMFLFSFSQHTHVPCD